MCRNRITGSETLEKIVSWDPAGSVRDYSKLHLISEKSSHENKRLAEKIPGNMHVGIM